MAEEPTNPGGAAKEGATPEGVAPNPQDAELATLKAEVEKLKTERDAALQQKDGAVKGMNEAFRERDQRLAEVQAQLQQLESQQQTVKTQADRDTQLKKLIEEFDGDEERAQKMFARDNEIAALRQEIGSLKGQLQGMQIETSNQKADNALAAAGVKIPDVVKEGVRTQLLNAAWLRSKREFITLDLALIKEAGKLADAFATAPAQDGGTPNPTEAKPGTPASKEPVIPTGGGTPTATPDKPPKFKTKVDRAEYLQKSYEERLRRDMTGGLG